MLSQDTFFLLKGAVDCPFFGPAVKVVLFQELCLYIPPFQHSSCSIYLHRCLSLKVGGAFCALLTTLRSMFIVQCSWAFCSQTFVPLLILSSKDHPYSLRQHRYLALKTFVLQLSFHPRILYIVSDNSTRELPLLGHVSLFWHLFAIFLQPQFCSSIHSCSGA